MKRRLAATVLALILALVLPLGLAADDAPGPTTRHLFRVDGPPLGTVN